MEGSVGTESRNYESNLMAAPRFPALWCWWSCTCGCTGVDGRVWVCGCGCHVGVYINTARLRQIAFSIAIKKSFPNHLAHAPNCGSCE